MEEPEPVIIVSDDEDDDDEEEFHATQKTIKRSKRRLPKDLEHEFPVKSKKKSTSSKNPMKQERQVFTWFLRQKFENHTAAADFILGQQVWSRWYNSSTESGAKQYYRCNRVKYSAKQCSARIYTRFSPNSKEVFLFSNNLQHDHDRSKDPSPHHRTSQTSEQVVGRLPLPLRHQKEDDIVSKSNYDVDLEEEPDDEFDEDFGDEDDEDSYFIDTSLLRVEIEEEPETFLKEDGMCNFHKKSIHSRELDEENEKSDDIVFVNEDHQEPSMKIAKVESHFNINKFIMDIPKQKFTRMNWHPVFKFSSGEEARNYILREKIWSKWYFSHTETGAKQYYRCNKAKYSGRQCAARIYLLYESNSDEVHLMVNGNDHDHNSTEFKTTYTALTDSLKRIIQKCCELKQKPKDIITKLEALNLPLPSRYHLRKYIVETQEKM